MTVAVTIGDTRLELSQGDITREAVDAIANAANEGLRGGGGVDGAIHRAGGPEIMNACRVIGRCPTGEAVITTGGLLPAKYVIHTVGPVWKGGRAGEADKLAACYRNSLRLAVENNCTSVAFPSISTGVYGYPLKEAARVALVTIRAFMEENAAPSLVRMILFNGCSYRVYSDALQKIFAD